MIIDFRTGGPLPDTAAATLVVGSGAAGLALALDLESRGLPVVLLESGGDPRDAAGVAADSVLNEGEVEGRGYRGLTGARARVLGGATQLWAGQCTRLHALDLSARAWVPGSGWPIALEELERWYPAAERWFGLSGGGYEADRWEEHASLQPMRWSPELEHDFTEYTPTPFLGSHHRRHLSRSALVVVLEHATVARVLVEGDRATGVEVRDRGGRREVLRARDVVLAAGAVENARVLQLSDPAGVGVGTGRDATGRYLQDHPVVQTAEVVPWHASWLQDRYSHLHRGRRRLYPKVRLSARAQEDHGLLAANAVFVHERSEPGLEAARRLVSAARQRKVPQGALGDARAAAGVVAPLARTAWRRWARGLSSGERTDRVWLQVWLEQVPDADSRVVLGSERDALGLPRARVRWRTHELERRTSRELTRWVAADLARAGVAQVRHQDVMVDDDAWEAAAVDAYHPSGTTRMSSDPRAGVVDANGAVHGVQGLHVVGSSTFPVAGYANPTLTIVALALRLSSRLATRGAGSEGAQRPSTTSR